jgi:hypothetical protein
VLFTAAGTSVTTAWARMSEMEPRRPETAQNRQSRSVSGARPAQNSGLRTTGRVCGDAAGFDRMCGPSCAAAEAALWPWRRHPCPLQGVLPRRDTELADAQHQHRHFCCRLTNDHDE